MINFNPLHFNSVENVVTTRLRVDKKRGKPLQIHNVKCLTIYSIISVTCFRGSSVTSRLPEGEGLGDSDVIKWYIYMYILIPISITIIHRT